MSVRNSDRIECTILDGCVVWCLLGQHQVLQIKHWLKTSSVVFSSCWLLAAHVLQKNHASPPEVDVWQPIQPVQFSVAVKAVVCNNEKTKEVEEQSDEDTSVFCLKIRFLIMQYICYVVQTFLISQIMQLSP